jgi:hypothetical protein
LGKEQIMLSLSAAVLFLFFILELALISTYDGYFIATVIAKGHLTQMSSTWVQLEKMKCSEDKEVLLSRDRV